MPTWMDFGFKNPPKSALGRLLGRLVAVLGRLGGLLRRLEEASKNEAKKRLTKSRQKVRLQASWWLFLADHVAGPNGMQLCSGPGKAHLSRRRVLTKETLHRKTTCRE